MGKRGTWAGAGAVALGLTGAGFAVDRRLRTTPLGALAALAAAGAYVVGTFSPGARIFGSPAELDDGDIYFALTFDDGPDPRYSLEISRMLAQRGHRSTFFVLGDAVRRHPDVASAIVSDGHELASHGYDHRLLAFASPRELRRQVAATDDAVREATGTPVQRLFRPPHGVRSPWLHAVVEQEGYRVVAWNGTVFDTAAPGVDVIARRVERLLYPGATVLLHDGDGSGLGASRHQTVAALSRILGAAEQRGFRSERVSALLRYPDSPPSHPSASQSIDAPEPRSGASQHLLDTMRTETRANRTTSMS